MYKETDLFKVKNRTKNFSRRKTYLSKSHGCLVKATDNLLKSGINKFKIIIVGEGEHRQMLEKMIKELNITKYIKLVGIRTDVIELMKEADIFVLPSRYEGLSIAMIEAMACGLPIIASDAPGINPYILNGVNGILFPIEDHKELAENIKKLANNRKLRHRFSIEGKKLFNSEFDMKKNINSLKKLIEDYVSI